MTVGDLLATWIAENGEGTISSARRGGAWLRHTLDLPVEPADTARWIRDVSSLSHIEANWATGRWTSAPLVITRLPASDGLALVAGRLTAATRHQLTELTPEAHLCAQPLPSGPPQLPRPHAVLLQYDSLDELRLAADELAAQYVPCAATQLATCLLPPQPGPAAAPPRNDDDTRDVFLAEELSWRRADRLAPPSIGLHRIDVQNRKRYLWFGPGGWQQCDLAAGTHLALAKQGCSSLRWRGSTGGHVGDVICDTGAPLPALHQRALVLCSGLLPTFSARAKTAIYSNIPPPVAHAVAASLGQSLDTV